MVKTILISTEDIIPGTKHMHDKLGRYDLLGQILYTGYGIKVHKFAETPASQGTLLSPFTCRVRNRMHNTELCLTILRNGSLPAKKQIELANNLLDPHCILLEKM